MRVTSLSWDDPPVVLPGEVLVLHWVDREVHAVRRAKILDPMAAPNPVEDSKGPPEDLLVILKEGGPGGEVARAAGARRLFVLCGKPFHRENPGAGRTEKCDSPIGIKRRAPGFRDCRTAVGHWNPS